MGYLDLFGAYCFPIRVHLKGVAEMKYMDIDCYERGCACTSSNRVAGEDCEVVDVVKFKEWQYLTDDEIKEIIGGYGNEGGIGGYTRSLIDKIEAKIREKNEKASQE